jgi:outer membrane immunogenic protein
MMTSKVHAATMGLLLVVAAPASQAALAADLGGGPPPRDFAPPSRAEVERWSGFYIGATAGYGFGSGRAGGDIGDISFDQDGALGTILAGYNWQRGSTVFGLETDVGTGNLGTSTATAFGTLHSEINAFGSFRARAGLLVSPALLLYGTAGLAWADFNFDITGGASRSETFFGWQAGVGAEFAFSPRVTLRAEYLFTDLSSERVVHSGFNDSYDPDFHTVRAGIAFKF